MILTLLNGFKRRLSLPSWAKWRRWPYVGQVDSLDCGPSCLQMISRFYGVNISSAVAAARYERGDVQGLSIQGLVELAESVGFEAKAFKVSLEQASVGIDKPWIALTEGNHFVVVYQLTTRQVILGDPACGVIAVSRDEFSEMWTGSSAKGAAVLLIPTSSLEANRGSVKNTWREFVLAAIEASKQYGFRGGLSAALVALLLLLHPYLESAIFDVGLAGRDLGLIVAIALVQCAVTLAQVFFETSQRWFLATAGARLEAGMSLSFVEKLLRLPLAIWRNSLLSDFMQRLFDFQRLRFFATEGVTGIVISTTTLLLYAVVLAYLSLNTLVVFAISAVLYIAVFVYCSSKRVRQDHLRFSAVSRSTAIMLDMMQGIRDVKLFGSEKYTLSKWKHEQRLLYKADVRSIRIDQLQSAAVAVIGGLRTAVISVFIAKQVVSGELSIGGMVAIFFVVGQVAAPLQHLVSILQIAPETSTTVDRIAAIHKLQEEDADLTAPDRGPRMESTDIVVQGVSFRYPGTHQDVIQRVSLTIPKGRITALVGHSGCGKSTLLRLLLRMYEPTSGSIRIGSNDVKTIASPVWRSNCGAVLQDGYIFQDSISSNISMSAVDDEVSENRIRSLCRELDLEGQVEALPRRLATKIGASGIGLSGGQLQRILIARALYRSPAFLFFDEPTSSLDTRTEDRVMNAITYFSGGATVLIIAHRLSTVRGADQIVVMDRGQVVEVGRHEELLMRRGHYYDLVNAQLVREVV
jgi:ATP-binding cassette, subfamily B, bacterial